ncbi:hypothetical protein QE390_003313 [Siphonobacter sp. SORGH_AS 1065]|nr:hypothetical protein [Siphonobacter sp. SORGH_AS_1065]
MIGSILAKVMDINLRLSYFSWILIIASTLVTLLLSFGFYLGSKDDSQAMLIEQGWVLILVARWIGFSLLSTLASVAIAVLGTIVLDASSYRQIFRISAVCNSIGAFLGTVAFVRTIMF